MAKQNRTILKAYFQQGDIPTQGQYADLIDSNLNLNDGGTQTLSGSISASSFISSTGITLAGDISSSGNLEIGSITSSLGVSVAGKLTAASATITDITGSNISASLQLITDKIQQGSAADGINIIGSITASANISASGTITGNTLVIDNFIPSNITASGAISASGALIGNSLTLGGTAITSTAAEINYLDGVLSTVKNAYDTAANVSQGVIRFTELDNGTDDLSLTGLTPSARPTFAGIAIRKDTLVDITFGDTFTDELGAGGFNTNFPTLEPGVAKLAAIISFPESGLTSVFSGTTNVRNMMVYGVNIEEDRIEVYIVYLATSGVVGGGIQVRYQIS